MPIPLIYDIVGCGAVVEYRHLPLLRALKGRGEVQVHGCYDLSEESARKMAHALGAERWGVAPQPVPGDGVSAALISAPPGAHAEIALEYIDAGKSVFIEKPFTTKVADAEILVERARDSDATVAVNHHWRFYPSLEALRRLLSERRLGKVDAVEASEGFRLGWTPASDYFTEDPFGGVLHDSGSHVLDAVLYVLGLDEPAAMSGFEVGQVQKEPPTEPSHDLQASFTVATRWDERIEVNLGLSRLRPRARAITIRGAFGVLFVPITFGHASTLFLDGQQLSFEADNEGGPVDDMDCILRGHREFAQAIDGGEPTRLTGERFIPLGRLLEDLWAAP